MTIAPRFPGEPIDALLSRLKRTVAKDRILNEAQTRARFVPPGVKRRSKSARARKRQGPTHGNQV